MYVYLFSSGISLSPVCKFSVDIPEFLLAIDIWLIHVEDTGTAPITEATDISYGICDDLLPLLTSRILNQIS